MDYLSGVSQEMINQTLEEKEKLLRQFAQENSKLRSIIKKLEKHLDSSGELFKEIMVVLKNSEMSDDTPAFMKETE